MKERCAKLMCQHLFCPYASMPPVSFHSVSAHYCLSEREVNWTNVGGGGGGGGYGALSMRLTRPAHVQQGPMQ